MMAGAIIFCVSDSGDQDDAGRHVERGAIRASVVPGLPGAEPPLHHFPVVPFSNCRMDPKFLRNLVSNTDGVGIQLGAR